MSFGKKILSEGLLLFSILLLSFWLRVAYVFRFTDYKNHLYSDFLGYWERALQRMDGNIYDEQQWGLYPILPHIVFSWLLKLFRLIGLDQVQLEAMLFVNILCSIASVWLVFKIAQEVLQSKNLALWSASVVGFSYPYVYLNAFIMSEHLAWLFMLTSIWLVLGGLDYLRHTLFAGLLFGLAVCFRPALGLVIFAFLLFFFLQGGVRAFLKKEQMLFMFSLALVLGLVSFENHRISQGEIFSPAANGGVNFYFSQCLTHELQQEGQAKEDIDIIPPATLFSPENGVFLTQIPFYQQNYYYKAGWNCLVHRDGVFFEKIAQFKELITGFLLPTRPEAILFDFFMIISRVLIFLGIVLLPLSFVLFSSLSSKASASLMLFSAICLQLFAMFLFNVEHRYFYSFGHLLTILLVGGVGKYFEGAYASRKYLRVSGYWLFFLVMSFAVMPWLKRPTIDYRVYSVKDQPLSLASAVPYRLIAQGKLRFASFPHTYETGTLHSGRWGSWGESFIIDLDSCFLVKKAGSYEFIVTSDDGFKLEVDGRMVSSYSGLRQMGATSSRVELEEGYFKIRARYFQSKDEKIFKIKYRARDEGQENELDFFPAHRLKVLGESSDTVEFFDSAKCWREGDFNSDRA